MLGTETQLLILGEIKRINKISDGEKRLQEFIAVKQMIVASINDDLDELFSGVNLAPAKTEQKDKEVVEKKVVQLSIAYSEDIQEAIDFDKLCQSVCEQLDGLYWYDKQILQLYIKLGNYRAVEKATGIPFSSIYKTVQKAIKQIKEKVAV